MNKQLLISEFLTTPWALMPERLQAMTAVLTRWSSDVSPSDETLFQINTDRVLRDTRKQFATDRAASNTGAGIAVLPLYGVVTQRGNMVDDISGPGSTSTQKFTSALRQVLADDTVGQILIDIDSPGGSVYGVAELATEIVKARAQKPVVAVANSLAASAAYWIGCSAGEFYVTPGGEVGSIGVWQAHFDYSKALESKSVEVGEEADAQAAPDADPGSDQAIRQRLRGLVRLNAQRLARRISRTGAIGPKEVNLISETFGLTQSRVEQWAAPFETPNDEHALAQALIELGTHE